MTYMFKYAYVYLMYHCRSKEIWSREAAQSLLYDGAALAIQQLGPNGVSASEQEVCQIV